MVGQRVDGLPAVPFYPDQAGSAQNPEVLGHQRLAHPEQVDQLVHEPRLISQLRDYRQPGRGRQHFQQLRRGLERLRLR
jgi:hypothetical protein